eukprot:IDg19030t1
MIFAFVSKLNERGQIGVRIAIEGDIVTVFLSSELLELHGIMNSQSQNLESSSARDRDQLPHAPSGHFKDLS